MNLQKRLDAAPEEHAEALLVAWDLLQAMHDQGVLDTMHGMVSAKDTISGTLAEYGKPPEGMSLMRNRLAIACPDDGRSRDTRLPGAGGGLGRARTSKEEKAPSFWQLAKRAKERTAGAESRL